MSAPEPGFGEVRIKLLRVGICGSDIHFFKGQRLLDKPTIIGHEGLGIIDKTGEGVTARNPGERVVIEPNIPCGRCSFCIQGRNNICENKRIVGLNEPGCFAQYVIVPELFAWKLPDTISDDDAVTIEPMAVAYHALFCTKAKPGDAIAIIGLGAIGLLLAHLALRMGYQVYVTEVNQAKTALAVEMGAESSVPQPDLELQTKHLAALWKTNQVVAVFECAGSSITASLAASAAPRGSEIVLVGLSEKQANFQPLKIAREGISIIPSIIYQHPFDFRRVIQLIEAKVVNPGLIISGNYPLSEIQQALESAASGNASKIVVEISDL
jgi:threonine dehydrogenase-like Zn-dependent dehydrogenase